MDTKKIIGWSVAGVVLVVVFAVAIVAAQVGSEASKLDGTMKSDLSAHLDSATERTKLASMGYSVDATTTTDGMTALGQKHWALAYGTWLTVKLTFNDKQKLTGYQIDRQSTWF